MESTERAEEAKPKRAPSLLNRAAVRALALATCEAEIGKGRVIGVKAGLYKDCEVAVRRAIERAVAQHRRGAKQLDGCVVLDLTTAARRRRRPS